MADTALTARTGWFHAAASLLLGAVSVAALAVNFLLAVPVGLAAVGSSLIGRRRDAEHRGIHSAALIMGTRRRRGGTAPGDAPAVGHLRRQQHQRSGPVNHRGNTA
ncbi:hypothetical protein [Streptomyces sp. NPDC000994]